MNLNALLLLVIIYILISAFLRKTALFLFDFIWRSLIAVGLYFVIRDSINITPDQWIFLGVTFVVGLFATIVLSPRKSLHYHLVGVVFAPLIEEFIFRGLLLSHIQGSTLMRVSIISILFGFYHLKNIQFLTFFSTIYQIIYAILIGFPLGYLAIYSRSLFLPILLHAINNIIAGAITMRYNSKIIKFKDD